MSKCIQIWDYVRVDMHECMCVSLCVSPCECMCDCEGKCEKVMRV